jgi:hypothetical protein
VEVEIVDGGWRFWKWWEDVEVVGRCGRSGRSRLRVFYEAKGPREVMY